MEEGTEKGASQILFDDAYMLAASWLIINVRTILAYIVTVSIYVYSALCILYIACSETTIKTVNRQWQEAVGNTIPKLISRQDYRSEDSGVLHCLSFIFNLRFYHVFDEHLYELVISQPGRSG